LFIDYSCSIDIADKRTPRPWKDSSAAAQSLGDLVGSCPKQQNIGS